MALIIRVIRLRERSRLKPRLVFMGAPISGLVSTAQAMRDNGYVVLSVANGDNFIGESARFDKILQPQPTDPAGCRTLLFAFRHLTLFWETARKYDIMHGYFNGGMFGAGPLMEYEYGLWKLAGRKVILMPYGSDAFVYKDLPETTWAKTIQKTYPHTLKEDLAIDARVKKFCKISDRVVGCLVHHTNLPKVSVNPLLWYPAEDLGDAPLPNLSGTIKVVHAPNHRLIKGTNILIQAINKLQQEGLDIKLDILEKQPRGVVIEAMKSADIVVDQIHAGYALHALEGMSLGKITFTGINLTEPIYAPHKDILEKSPLIFTSESTLLHDLRNAITNRQSWHTQSHELKLYVTEYHSPQTIVNMFTALYKTLE